VVAPEDIVPQIDISIQNNYGRCGEDIHFSLDGANIWTSPSSWSWQAETENLLSTGIKAYVKCNENLTGGIACPKIKIKNPKATGYFVDDRDGQAYQIVKIGEQTWFAENLNYEGRCYGDKDENCVTYGGLSHGVTGVDGNTRPYESCPDGWHTPSNAEWDTLMIAVGGSNTAETKLKATSGWNEYQGKSGNGTDDYGFAALPGGNGNYQYTGYLYFGNIGYGGSWWVTNNNSVSFRYIGNSGGGGTATAMMTILSVRCVQD
jgi:uncharacterized protein (TIGR02145 family)